MKKYIFFFFVVISSGVILAEMTLDGVVTRLNAQPTVNTTPVIVTLENPGVQAMDIGVKAGSKTMPEFNIKKRSPKIRIEKKYQEKGSMEEEIEIE